MKRTVRGFIVVAVCFFFSTQTWALDIYFVRHAETVANATGNYTDENQKEFTEKGEKQRNELVKNLEPYVFDYILVSPLYRTRETIKPYLMRYHRRAEIWPEFAECCWQNNQDEPAVLPLKMGDEIGIFERENRYFIFRDPKSHFFYNTNERFADGVEQLKKGTALLEKRYGDTDMSILVVAHSLSIGTMLQLLLNQPISERPYIENTAISHVYRNPDGTYALLMLNGENVADV